MKLLLFAFVAVWCVLLLEARCERYVTLSNGLKVPVIGLGTFAANGDDLDKAIDAAIDAGYRHIDTATLYGNEDIIGRSIKRAIDAGKVKREDLFILTKLPSNGLRADLVPHFLDNSLRKLQLDYVDMYLIHNTIGYHYHTDEDFNPVNSEGLPDLDYKTNLSAVWQAMEEQVDAGKTKSIGLSNVNASQVARILKQARIKPTDLQVELHAYLQQQELVDFAKQNNIVVTAYSPLGSPRPGRPGELSDPVVLEIAAKHGKSAGQILLRHCLQRGLVCIPKSTTPSRIRQNIDVFNFQLDSEDLQKLSALDKGPDGRLLTFDWSPGMKEHPEYPF